ncbi:MAG: hypothetical protein ABIH42_02470 [Planctomycetota bacterium]
MARGGDANLQNILDLTLKSLAGVFDKLADSQLEPFPKMEEDKTRQEIDAAISTVFGLPDLAPVRSLLTNEPIVTLKPLHSN